MQILQTDGECGGCLLSAYWVRTLSLYFPVSQWTCLQRWWASSKRKAKKVKFKKVTTGIDGHRTVTMLSFIIYSILWIWHDPRNVVVSQERKWLNQKWVGDRKWVCQLLEEGTRSMKYRSPLLCSCEQVVPQHMSDCLRIYLKSFLSKRQQKFPTFYLHIQSQDANLCLL